MNLKRTILAAVVGRTMPLAPAIAQSSESTAKQDKIVNEEELGEAIGDAISKGLNESFKKINGLLEKQNKILKVMCERALKGEDLDPCSPKDAEN